MKHESALKYVPHAIIFAIFLHFLTGCATTKGPEVVKVPVSVACIDPTDVPDKPKLTFESTPWTTGAGKAKELLVDYYNLQAYAVRLEILVSGCVMK